VIGARALRERLSARRGAMVEELARAVAIDSPTFPPAGANAVASRFAERYRALGFEVERLPGARGTGDHMLARLRGRRPEGARLLLIGHCDTVFPEGEAARRPFAVEGDTARGPGVADMKGSLVACLFAVEALLEEGFGDFGEILILYDTDEERGNPSSRPLIEELGRGASAALIIEPARASGALVTARKGSIYGKIAVRGVPAHAGVDPERGRSAVLELAHQIVRLSGLERAGGTVNVTGLAGGERPHIVAGEASCHVELRAPSQARLDEMEEDLRGLLQKTFLDGTSLAFERLGGRPALERNAGTDRLLKIAEEVAREAGVPFLHTPTGGGSDGNYLCPLGVPVLDGLGPVGGNLHTEEEYLELDSLAPRAALLGGMVERLGATGLSS